MSSTRSLRVVFGDQLDRNGPAVRDAEPGHDVVVMAEAAGEVRRYPYHKARVVLFLAAMRHFRDDMVARGLRVDYAHIDGKQASTLTDWVSQAMDRHAPKRVVVTRPGRHDLLVAIKELCAARKVALEVREDDHFVTTPAMFETWMAGRKSPILEHFYRKVRRDTGVLMDGRDPAGGEWNFDKDNRKAFGKNGPVLSAPPPSFERTVHVRAVIEAIERDYSDLPGELDTFNWPVNPVQAQAAVDHFLTHRLREFGTYQDAMWAGRPFLFHSLLATSLNLKLLDPLDVARRAEHEYRSGRAPINAVEGFVRQVIGWREYIRGIYWHAMPGYGERNSLGASQELPDLFWSGQTRMRCMRETVGQLLRHGYAHHIQRLMVTGLFALLYGVDPRQIHEWYMAYFVDSVEWVTLPNVVGMSQWADEGLLATKPYVASGKYIDRMSNYCGACPFDPSKAAGDDACPFTTMYWTFLDDHRERLGQNRRMQFQLRNLDRKSSEELQLIRLRESELRSAVRENRL